MLLRILIASLCLFAAPAVAQEFFPLSEIETGQTGVGRTVYEGTEIEEFGVEILGVLENVGPKQSLIIGRLSGETVERTGVLSGMSGSPVYIDGRLAGAVAFAFPFSTDPLAGIRPIEDMVAPVEQATANPSSAAAGVLLGESDTLLPETVVSKEPGTLIPIATPVSFGGFTSRTLDVFGEQLRGLGLQPLQGIGGNSSAADGAAIEPGSMISVGLIRGDLNVSAAGTVTHVDNGRVYAFGHRFLSTGPAKLPMMSSHVLTSVKSLQNSFKLAGAGGVVGSIGMDRTTGVVGTLGETAELTPLRIRLESLGVERTYNLELARDPALTPFLMQLAAFGAIDATERQVGALTLRIEGEARFDGIEPLQLDGLYSGPSAIGQMAALNVGALLAFVTQSGSAAPDVDSIDIRIQASDEDRRARSGRAWAQSERVKPGETLALRAAVRLPDGSESIEEFEWRVPISTPAGPLQVTFSDATGLNMLDLPLLLEAGKLSPNRIVHSLNGLRSNDRLYVRVWRPQRGLRVETARLSSPPASLRAILDTPRGAAGGATAEASTTLEEAVAASYDAVLEGRQNVQVTITE